MQARMPVMWERLEPLWWRIKDALGKALPGLKASVVARRAWRSDAPAHFRLFASSICPAPAPVRDRPAEEIETVNRSSLRYFEKAENREFWLNRPFSSQPTAGKYLWRFGLLVSALDVRPGHRVLDFGCGTGWTSIMLARIGAEVVGSDIAPAALAIAREVADRELLPRYRERLEFRLYSGGRIEADDEFFDHVLVFDAFHHFPNPMELLREFHRVLGAQGRFGFSEPGVGHAATEASIAEREHGVLEEDVDLEQLFRSGTAAGFQDLELPVPALEPEILTLSMARMRWYLRGLSWLVPSYLHRSAVLRGPIGVFSKGPYAVSSLHPRHYMASIRPATRTLSVRGGQEFIINATVENRCDTVYLKEGRRGVGYVRLGAHLLTEDGRLIEMDFGRAGLPEDLPRGARARMRLDLKAPSGPGRHIVRLDMVNEGVCWFAEKGSKVADVALNVV
jgi:SAM-dependent methyltransferase